MAGGKVFGVFTISSLLFLLKGSQGTVTTSYSTTCSLDNQHALTGYPWTLTCTYTKTSSTTSVSWARGGDNVLSLDPSTNTITGTLSDLVTSNTNEDTGFSVTFLSMNSLDSAEWVCTVTDGSATTSTLDLSMIATCTDTTYDCNGTTYIVQDKADRHMSVEYASVASPVCDCSLIGWYGFKYNGDWAEIPSDYIEPNYCGAQVSMRLSTAPTLVQTGEEQVISACASYVGFGNNVETCGMSTVLITVKQCDTHYIYQLPGFNSTWCNSAYCTKKYVRNDTDPEEDTTPRVTYTGLYWGSSEDSLENFSSMYSLNDTGNSTGGGNVTEIDMLQLNASLACEEVTGCVCDANISTDGAMFGYVDVEFKACPVSDRVPRPNYLFQYNVQGNLRRLMGSRIHPVHNSLQFSWNLADGPYPDEDNEALAMYNWVQGACKHIMRSENDSCNVETIRFPVDSHEGLNNIIYMEVFTNVNLTTDEIKDKLLFSQAEYEVSSQLDNIEKVYVVPTVINSHSGMLTVTLPSNMVPDVPSDLIRVSSAQYQDKRLLVEKQLLRACTDADYNSFCHIENVVLEMDPSSSNTLLANFTLLTGPSVTTSMLTSNILIDVFMDGTSYSSSEMTLTVLTTSEAPLYTPVTGYIDIESVMVWSDDLENKTSDLYESEAQLIEDWLLSTCRMAADGFCHVDNITFVHVQNNDSDVFVYFQMRGPEELTDDLFKDNLAAAALDMNILFNMVMLRCHSHLRIFHPPPKPTLLDGTMDLTTTKWNDGYLNPSCSMYNDLRLMIIQLLEQSCQALTPSGVCSVKRVSFAQTSDGLVTVTYLMLMDGKVSPDDMKHRMISSPNGLTFTLGKLGKRGIPTYGLYRRVEVEVKMTLSEMGGQPVVWSDKLLITSSEEYLSLKANVITWVEASCANASAEACRVLDVIFVPGSVEAIVTMESGEDLSTAELGTVLDAFAVEFGVNHTTEAIGVLTSFSGDASTVNITEMYVFITATAFKVNNIYEPWRSNLSFPDTTDFAEMYNQFSNWILSGCRTVSRYTCEMYSLHFVRQNAENIGVVAMLKAYEDLTLDNLRISMDVISNVLHICYTNLVLINTTLPEVPTIIIEEPVWMFKYEGSAILDTVSSYNFTAVTLSATYEAELVEKLKMWLNDSCNEAAAVNETCDVTNLTLTLDADENFALNFVVLSTDTFSDYELLVKVVDNQYDHLVAMEIDRVKKYYYGPPPSIYYHVVDGIVELKLAANRYIAWSDQLANQTSVEYKHMHALLEFFLTVQCDMVSNVSCDVHNIFIYQGPNSEVYANFTMLAGFINNTDTLAMQLAIGNGTWDYLAAGVLDMMANDSMASVLMDVVDPMLGVIYLNKYLLFPPVFHYFHAQVDMEVPSELMPAQVMDLTMLSADEYLMKRRIIEKQFEMACYNISMFAMCEVEEVVMEMEVNSTIVSVNLTMLAGTDISDATLLTSLGYDYQMNDINFTFVDLHHEKLLVLPFCRKLTVNIDLNSVQSGMVTWDDDLASSTSAAYRDVVRQLEQWIVTSCRKVSDGRCFLRDVEFTQNVTEVYAAFDLITSTDFLDSVYYDSLSFYSVDYYVMYDIIDSSSMEIEHIPPTQLQLLKALITVEASTGQNVTWNDLLKDPTTSEFKYLSQNISNWMVASCEDMTPIGWCSTRDISFIDMGGSVTANVTMVVDGDIMNDTIQGAMASISTAHHLTYSVDMLWTEPFTPINRVKYRLMFELIELLGLPVEWNIQLVLLDSPEYMQLESLLRPWLETACASITNEPCTVEELRFEFGSVNVVVVFNTAEDSTAEELQFSLDASAQSYGVNQTINSTTVIDTYETVPNVVYMDIAYIGSALVYKIDKLHRPWTDDLWNATSDYYQYYYSKVNSWFSQACTGVSYFPCYVQFVGFEPGDTEIVKASFSIGISSEIDTELLSQAFEAVAETMQLCFSIVFIENTTVEAMMNQTEMWNETMQEMFELYYNMSITTEAVSTHAPTTPATTPEVTQGPARQFRCKTQAYIPIARVCDSHMDCHDHSDEWKELCKSDVKVSRWFQCNSGEYIQSERKCNHEKDCYDGSDEMDCSPYSSSLKLFRCNKGEYIFLVWTCDGNQDCADGSDEMFCPEPEHYTPPTTMPFMNYTTPTYFEPSTTELPTSLFRCADGQQIPKTWTCDNLVDCLDLSDEINCPLSADYSVVPKEPIGPYPVNLLFKCQSSMTMEMNKVCDGTMDCPNNVDELYCAVGATPRRWFNCGAGQYIQYERACDSFSDCNDGTDEFGCTDAPLRIGELKASTSSSLIISTISPGNFISNGAFYIHQVGDDLSVFSNDINDRSTRLGDLYSQLVTNILVEACLATTQQSCIVQELVFSSGSVRVDYRIVSKTFIDTKTTSFENAIETAAENNDAVITFQDTISPTSVTTTVRAQAPLNLQDTEEPTESSTSSIPSNQESLTSTSTKDDDDDSQTTMILVIAAGAILGIGIIAVGLALWFSRKPPMKEVTFQAGEGDLRKEPVLPPPILEEEEPVVEEPVPEVQPDTTADEASNIDLEEYRSKATLPGNTDTEEESVRTADLPEGVTKSASKTLML